MEMPEHLLHRVTWLVGLVLSPIIFSSSVLAKPQLVFPIPTIGVLSEPASKALENALRNRQVGLQLSRQVGLQFEDSQTLNEGKLVSLTGTTTTTIAREPGRCVGTLYIPPIYDTITSPYTVAGSAKARFLSKTVPPASGLSVVIRNTTSGIDQSLSPYTDREYSQSDHSESFIVKQDTVHSARYLAVIPGMNTFTYQIRENDKVIESGSFTAMIAVETKADKQSTAASFNSTTLSSNPFDSLSSPCEQPNSTDIKVPDLEPLQIPEVPVLSPDDIQQLLDQPKK
jgi:hypothetical protein